MIYHIHPQSYTRLDSYSNSSTLSTKTMENFAEFCRTLKLKNMESHEENRAGKGGVLDSGAEIYASVKHKNYIYVTNVKCNVLVDSTCEVTPFNNSVNTFCFKVTLHSRHACDARESRDRWTSWNGTSKVETPMPRQRSKQRDGLLLFF